jgi:hypothetical protein
MSVQSGTIAPRRTVELPMWAAGVMALIVVALIATVVVERQTTPAPTAITRAVVHASFPDALETSGFGRLPKVAPTFPSALETSGFGRVSAQASDVRPGAVSGGAPQPIMIGDYACHQCR